MSSSNLDPREKYDLISREGTFGTIIELNTGKETILLTETQDWPLDPILNPSMTQGRLFRSPRISASQLAQSINSLRFSTPDSVNIQILNRPTKNINRDTETYYMAYVRFGDDLDATAFSLSQSNVFQKWSDQMEKEYLEELNKPDQELTVEDGVVKGVRVTVTKLGD